MWFGDFRDPITTGAGIGLGGRESIKPPAVLGAPTFVVEDAGATVAAHYTWDRLPGMAVKDMGDWTSIYVGSLHVPHELLAPIADRAGVHRYSEAGDIVYANDHFLAVHTPQVLRQARLHFRHHLGDASFDLRSQPFQIGHKIERQSLFPLQRLQGDAPTDLRLQDRLSSSYDAYCLPLYFFEGQLGDTGANPTASPKGHAKAGVRGDAQL